MNPLFLLTALWCLTCFELTSQTKFVLEPTQSMIMTGKGAGQDGTINPYVGQDCFAIVKNIGKRTFTAMVQQKGKIIEEISIAAGELKKVVLLKGYELYLDPNPKGKARASVAYQPMIN